MFKKIISKISALIEIKKRQRGTRALLRKLENDTDDEMRKLLNTFNFIISKKAWTVEEKEALIKVNEIKNGYLSSSESVTLRDFGAGKPGSKRTEKEMEEGIEVIASISDICRRAASKEK